MEHRASIFSQKLDRVAFTAYFLGAVVPMLALGIVVNHFVLPVVSDRLASYGLMGAVVSIAVLSLASFFTLRRTTRSSLLRMDRDNARLMALLDAARAMAEVRHGNDAAAAAAQCALELTDARACVVFARGEPGSAPVRMGAAGESVGKLEQELAEPLVKTANLVLADGMPVLVGPEDAVPALAAAPLPGEAAASGAIVAIGADDARAFDAEVLHALATLGGLASVALQNADLQDAQRNFFTHVTDMLVAALDSHLGYHHGHGTRVASLANRVGRKLGLSDRRLERLHFSALLHDIGMLKLDRDTPMNRRSAARHTMLGARMLSRIRVWHEIAPLVQHHHERWDGAGYPDGISSTAIPLESRIISVCDAFDTITSASSYKDALPFDDAVHEIESGAGTQFDPDVVGAFVALVREGVIAPD